MKTLRIIGAGGHGRVLADIAQAVGYTDIAFLDQNFPDFEVSGAWTIVGKPQELGAEDYAIGAGDNRIRFQLLKTMTRRPVTLIHPSAVVSPHAQIGAGSVICANAVVGPFTVLGQGCIVNTGASVDHDCILEDCVHISPGARLSGGVAVGARSWVGVGAVVRETTKIGADALVAAGAAVVKDVADNVRVAGVPAKSF